MDAIDRIVAQRRVMDKNVILRLYAHPRADTAANDRIQKAAEYCPPRRGTQSMNDFDCRRRQQILLDETHSANDQEAAYDDQPYIEFRFDTVRSHSQGFLLGTDQNCDFKLPDGWKLSREHLCITFDDKRHLVVKDLGSKTGTAVSYSGEFHDTRSRFTWIIGGIRKIQEKNIVIEIKALKLSFRAFINHDIFADAGSASLIDQFRRQMTDEDIAADQWNNPYTASVALKREHVSVSEWRSLYTSAVTLSDADISAMLSNSGPPTAAGTGTQTLSTEPFFLRDVIGKGSFAWAICYLNISTGKTYVEKTPVGDYEAEKWENEISIMQRLGEHENIVPLLHYAKVPPWSICLPYYPLGNLETIWRKQKPGISLGQVTELLKQCLAVLKHAHEKKVAHRDMKLSNILVESLTPFKIRVADFGESKATSVSELKTYCGTEIYMAPEVIGSRSNRGGRYSIACDLWSLGSMLSEVLFGRPPWPRPRVVTQDYCDAVLAQTRRPCEADLQHLQTFLLANLLIVDPERRQTAAACYDLAMALPSVNEPSRIMTGHPRPTAVPTTSPTSSTTTTTDGGENDPVQASGPSTIRPPPSRGSKRRLEDDAEAGQEPLDSKRPFAGKKPYKRAAELRPAPPVGDTGAVFEEPASDDSDQTAPSDPPPSLPAGASGAGSAICEPQLQLSRAEPAHGPRQSSPVHPAVSLAPQSPRGWPTTIHDVPSAKRNRAALDDARFQLFGAESAHRGPAVGSAGPSSPGLAHDVLSANRNSAAREPQSQLSGYEVCSAGDNSAARDLQFQLSRAESAHRRHVDGSAGPSSTVHPAVSSASQNPEWPAHEVVPAKRNSIARRPRS